MVSSCTCRSSFRLALTRLGNAPVVLDFVCMPSVANVLKSWACTPPAVSLWPFRAAASDSARRGILSCFHCRPGGRQRPTTPSYLPPQPHPCRVVRARLGGIFGSPPFQLHPTACSPRLYLFSGRPSPLLGSLPEGVGAQVLHNPPFLGAFARAAGAGPAWHVGRTPYSRGHGLAGRHDQPAFTGLGAEDARWRPQASTYAGVTLYPELNPWEMKARIE
jgi:hypothetical protein